MAAVYDREGADELTFLDITASWEQRETTYDIVRRTAEQVFIPLTVGGGVRAVDDVRRLLRAGADKVAINTAAVRDPEMLLDATLAFGSQCIVIAIDARARNGSWEVVVEGGRTPTGLDAVDWAARCTKDLGAGEVLLTSMDRMRRGPRAGDRERRRRRPCALHRSDDRWRGGRGVGRERLPLRRDEDLRGQG